MGGACSTSGRDEDVYKLLVGKSKGKLPLGRPRRRWEDNIRIDLRENIWEWVKGPHLA